MDKAPTIKMRIFRLDKEALFVSGVKKDSQVSKYLNKLDQLYQLFIHEMMPDNDLLNRARLLFKWLWKEKPSRYKPHGSYRLTDVIDAQLSKDTQTVGNCLGLTLLYNCLLLRMGIKAEALYLENGFGIGPHVLTILRIKEFIIEVENILPEGFNYKRHLYDPLRIRWQDKDLIADIYHSLGNESFEKRGFSAALKYYDIAITLNPQYEKACLNRAILLDKMEKEAC